MVADSLIWLILNGNIWLQCTSDAEATGNNTGYIHVLGSCCHFPECGDVVSASKPRREGLFAAIFLLRCERGKEADSGERAGPTCARSGKGAGRPREAIYLFRSCLDAAVHIS